MAIQAQDTFATGGRGSPNAWSPASDVTDNWGQLNGSATLGFTGTQGTLTGATNANVMTLGTKTLNGVDLVCHFDSTDPGALTGIFGRCTNASNYYRANYNWSTGNLELTKRVNGSETLIASVPVDTPAPGVYVHLMMNTNSTDNLACSCWADGENDPGFQIIATDLSLRSVGQFGIYVRLASSSKMVSCDSFVAQDPAPFPALPQPPASIPDSPYGMTLFVKTKTVSYLSKQTTTDLLGIANGAWLRYQLQWKQIEPNADQNYNWSYLDWAVSFANSYGLNFLWPIQAPPLGYLTIRATDGSMVPAGTGSFASAAAWATFVAAVCARYNGTVASPYSGYPMLINAIQFGNEDYDLSGGGVGNNQPARDILSQWLVPVVQACYSIVRAALPNAYIGLNAVRHTPSNGLLHIQNWITNFFTYLGGIPRAMLLDPKAWLDFHYYRDGTLNFDNTLVLDPTVSTFTAAGGSVNVPSVQLELSTILGIIRAYGGAMGCWCTEHGWNLYNASTDKYVSDSNVSTLAQDQSYRQAMADAMREGGGGKLMDYTYEPSAKVTTKNLPLSPTNPTIVPTLCSTEQKSETQFISNVYTYEPGYLARKNYAGVYPSWPGNLPTTAAPATFRDGVETATFRDGLAPAAGFRDGKEQATFRDGKQQATFRDGIVPADGR